MAYLTRKRSIAAPYLCALLLATSACENFDDLEVGEGEDLAIPSVSPEAQLATAQRAYNTGLFGEAQSGFAAILERDPSNVRAAVGLGETLFQMDRYAAAIPNFERALAIGPKASLAARAHLGIGLSNREIGDLSAARSALEKAVRADPDLWRAWLALGRIYTDAGSPDLARNAYENAARAGGGVAIAHNEIGMWHLEEKRPQDALVSFRRALELDGSLEVARGNVRLAHAVAGDYQSAINGATQTELPDVLNNVGYIAMVNKDYDDAERLLNQAIASSTFHNAAAVANLKLLQSIRNSAAGSGP